VGAWADNLSLQGHGYWNPCYHPLTEYLTGALGVYGTVRSPGLVLVGDPVVLGKPN